MNKQHFPAWPFPSTAYPPATPAPTPSPAHEVDLEPQDEPETQTPATTRRNELMTQITFSNTGDFKAMQAAEDWCAEHGISVGQCQRGDPRGLLRGDYSVAKWRNLSEDERAALDGLMTGDMRNGPVIVGLWVKP